MAKNHPPYTNDVDEVVVGLGDIIAAGFHILTVESRIAPAVREMILKNPDVQYAWGRDTSLLFAPKKL